MNARKQISPGGAAARVALGLLVILVVVNPGGDIRRVWLYVLVAGAAGLLTWLGARASLRARERRDTPRDAP